MINKFFALSICLILPALSYGQQLPQEGSQVGRYQMVSLGSQLYLLDTTNGCLWISTKKNCWVFGDRMDIEAWTPLITIPVEN